MIYLKLFLAFLQIGLFSIGGGYAAIPLIREQTVDINMWISMNEFSDIAAIAEMTPGPIAINAATFVGIKTAGFLGGLAATAGSITPSCIISSILAFIYYKYKGAKTIQSVLKSIRPATIGLILSAGISLFLYAVFENGVPAVRGLDVISLVIFITAFIILRKTKIPPIPVMLGCGMIYLAASLLLSHFT